MNYNARYYDPLTARFTQPDTIVPNPANPQDFNRYSYVANNPVRYSDPSGHCYGQYDEIWSGAICDDLFSGDEGLALWFWIVNSGHEDVKISAGIVGGGLGTTIDVWFEGELRGGFLITGAGAESNAPVGGLCLRHVQANCDSTALGRTLVPWIANVSGFVADVCTLGGRTGSKVGRTCAAFQAVELIGDFTAADMECNRPVPISQGACSVARATLAADAFSAAAANLPAGVPPLCRAGFVGMGHAGWR